MNRQTVLGIDTGGTFTDFVLLRNNQLQLHKVLSTPGAPERAILQGMVDLGVDPDTPNLRIIHGTTVATNAALERKGVKTVFVTNHGFKDLLTIGRQARKELYNLTPDLVEPPVPENLCIEIDCRRDAQGDLIQPLKGQNLDSLLSQLEDLNPSSVAICLLFSFLNSFEEEQIQSAITERFGTDIFVSRSSWVLPEYKEYERGIATWYNAYLGPLVKEYLSRLQKKLAPAPLAVMQSSGTTISADQAATRAVNLMLSGPAGGLAAVAHLGELIGQKKLLSFDMGGTSTDVALIDGALKLTDEGKIGDFPVAVPMVDMHTIGAGGGSLAYTDSSGMLRVGPESAGASPGPACYGQGGSQTTVTDANTVLGRLLPDNFLGGRMQLDLHSAEQALDKLAEPMKLSAPEAAQGVVALANEHMVQALRLISEQRGYDPKDYMLCGFGGAGGMHICELADALGMQSAVVPAMGGVLSAFGMLVAPAGRELSKAALKILDEETPEKLNVLFEDLEQQAIKELREEGHQLDDLAVQRTLDCRYKGQSYFLNIAWTSISETAETFHKAHKNAYGHRFDLLIEIVSVRISASLPCGAVTPLGSQTMSVDGSEKQAPRGKKSVWMKGAMGEMEKRLVPVVSRESISVSDKVAGPLLVCEEASTTWVGLGWEVKADKWQNLLLSRTGQN